MSGPSNPKTQQHVTFADTEPQRDDIINISRHDLLELTEHFRLQEEQINTMSKEILIAKNDIEKESYML